MPRMGGYVPADHASRHQDGGRDEISLASLSGTPAALTTHEADADVHHSEEIPDGRAIYNTTKLLVIPGNYSRYQNATSFVADRIYYIPIYVRTPLTIDKVVIEVTANASAGEKCRIAIYAAGTDWQPGARQVASAEIAIDSIALVSTTITVTTLQEGRYLIAITLEGNATLRSVRAATASIGFDPTLGAGVFPLSIYVAASYAALPDPGTDWDTPSFDTAPMYCPVFLNVSTP